MTIEKNKNLNYFGSLITIDQKENSYDKGKISENGRYLFEPKSVYEAEDYRLSSATIINFNVRL